MEIIKSIKVELSEDFLVIAGCVYSIIAEDDFNFRKNGLHVLLDQMIDMDVDLDTLKVVLAIANAAMTGDSEEERNNAAKKTAVDMVTSRFKELNESDNFDPIEDIIEKMCSKIQLADQDASESILEEVFDKMSCNPNMFSVIDGGAEEKLGDGN